MSRAANYGAHVENDQCGNLLTFYYYERMRFF